MFGFTNKAGRYYLRLYFLYERITLWTNFKVKSVSFESALISTILVIRLNNKLIGDCIGGIKDELRCVNSQDGSDTSIEYLHI